MALTKVQTNAIEDDAVTTDKLANAINTERTANTAKVSLENNSVTLAKMAGGTDGQIITYDANGDPLAVGPGTDGQVLTSTGAGSPPAFENLPTSGATLSGSTDNTVVTVTGSNAMQGEANLKFDGNNLTQTIDADGEGIILDAAGNHKAVITGNTNRTTVGNTIFMINGKWDDTEVARISVEAGADTTDKDDGILHFYTRASGGSLLSTLKLDQSRNVTITDGDLVIGTSGHGISFAATADTGATGASAAGELLDDYEEGTWTPTLKCASSDPTTLNVTVYGNYVKIGSLVHIQLYFSRFDIDSVGSGTARLGGLPFNVANLSYTPFGQCTHTNDKFASSKIPYAVYGRTNTDLLQFIEQNGTQINYSSTDSYYLGVSMQYYTEA